MHAFPQQAHTSTITLSKSAFEQNINFIKSKMASDTELAAVLKGNAYGHGIEPITELCLEAQVRTICVFSAYEAFRVQQQAKGRNIRIIIMGYISEEILEWAIGNEIEFFVFSFERLQAAISAAQKLQRAAKIHLEVETGMNRTGFEKDKLSCLQELLTNKYSQVHLMGLCTHFAGAEEMANHVRIRHQQKELRWWKNKLKQHAIPVKQVHAVCSAGLLNYPMAQHNLVRVGIMLYGFWPSLETKIMQLRQHSDPLRRLMQWTSQVMSVKEVKLGEYIGYGASFLATSDMQIATVPVGYAYGFSRSLSNNGRVLVGGKPAPVIGVVNMNLLIINISNFPEVKPGDEVVLIGKQGDQEISVASFSEMSQQLNYELLTRLPVDIPRTVIT